MVSNTARNIVLLFDGTNNNWKPGPHKTNVVKLSESLLVADERRQISYYDPGVGTAEGTLSESGGLAIRDRITRLAGLAWGDGVWANVVEGYRFIMQRYQPGDRIYVLGFSRGAFTARAVTGLLHLCGLLKPWHENLLPSLIEIYRSGNDTPDKRDSRLKAGAEMRANFGIDYPEFEVHFVGVWDTVESVGLSQLLFDSRISSDPCVKSTYRHVRHAVALDELRWPYTPRLYYSEGDLPADHTYKQVWFCGAHCDVGGSYAEAGLSNAALHWMAREAYQQGLLLDLNKLQEHKVNHYGLLHDQVVAGPIWTLGWAFRREYEQPAMRVHESVVDRIRKVEMNYAPPICKEHVIEKTLEGTVKMPDGSVLSLPPIPVEHKPELPSRVGLQWWHWLWLIISASATGMLIHESSPLQFGLAQMQLLAGWGGALGQRLNEWSAMHGVNVARLLESDYLFILAYSSLLPILILFAQRFESGLYPSASIAKILGFCGGWLVAADVLENLLTLWAMQWDEGACHTRICAFSEFVVSCLVSAVSAVKILMLAGFAGALAFCLLQGLGRLIRSAFGKG